MGSGESANLNTVVSAHMHDMYYYNNTPFKTYSTSYSSECAYQCDVI